MTLCIVRLFQCRKKDEGSLFHFCMCFCHCLFGPLNLESVCDSLWEAFICIILALFFVDVMERNCIVKERKWLKRGNESQEDDILIDMPGHQVQSLQWSFTFLCTFVCLDCSYSFYCVIPAQASYSWNRTVLIEQLGSLGAAHVAAAFLLTVCVLQAGKREEKESGGREWTVWAMIIIMTMIGRRERTGEEQEGRKRSKDRETRDWLTGVLLSLSTDEIERHFLSVVKVLTTWAASISSWFKRREEEEEEEDEEDGNRSLAPGILFHCLPLFDPSPPLLLLPFLSLSPFIYVCEDFSLFSCSSCIDAESREREKNISGRQKERSLDILTQDTRHVSHTWHLRRWWALSRCWGEWSWVPRGEETLRMLFLFFFESSCQWIDSLVFIFVSLSLLHFVHVLMFCCRWFCSRKKEQPVDCSCRSQVTELLFKKRTKWTGEVLLFTREREREAGEKKVNLNRDLLTRFLLCCYKSKGEGALLKY